MTELSQLDALRKALADADRVINECICFPSASLSQHKIRWLTDKIELSKDRYTNATSNAEGAETLSRDNLT